MRRQSCQQDGAEQQRERAAPPGHVCASAHGGVSGVQSRFAGADCPAGQPCRPADRRARYPADRRMESVHVPPPFLCGSVCAAALFHAGGGIALRGRAFCISGAEPGRHWLSLPRGRGPSQTPPSLATDSSISPGPPLSLAAGTAHRERSSVGVAANREFLPPGTTRREPLPVGFAADHGFSPRGCKGRSPLHKKTKNLPLPHWGRGSGG